MIEIYTTDKCPMCKILKEKMDKKNIQYNEVSDIKILMEKNIRSVPVLNIDGVFMNFVEANSWVNER